VVDDWSHGTRHLRIRETEPGEKRTTCVNYDFFHCILVLKFRSSTLDPILSFHLILFAIFCTRIFIYSVPLLLLSNCSEPFQNHLTHLASRVYLLLFFFPIFRILFTKLCAFRFVLVLYMHLIRVWRILVRYSVPKG